MQKIKVTVFLLVVCLFALGCTAISSGNKLVKKNKMFKEHDITKDIVVSKLGDPENIFQKDGNEVYQYNYTKISPALWTYFPIVGCTGEVFNFGKTVYDSYYAYIFFDKNGNYIKDKKIKLRGTVVSLDEIPEPLRKKTTK